MGWVGGRFGWLVGWWVGGRLVGWWVGGWVGGSVEWVGWDGGWVGGLVGWSASEEIIFTRHKSYRNSKSFFVPRHSVGFPKYDLLIPTWCD